jgi:adenine-specific DNA-methyltransferase
MKRIAGQIELFLPVNGGEAKRKWELFPQTRFLGSKRKLLILLDDAFSRIEFETALDPFAGTGAVAYLLKTLGIRVTASDYLESNATISRALVANSTVRLSKSILEELVVEPDDNADPGFIEQTFEGIFFKTLENRFIDAALNRIGKLDGPMRDLALYCLFQSCLAKRPYNLFHRANLSMRNRDVSRSFGNKTTWETPFEVLLRRNAKEANAAIIDTGQPCKALCADVFEIDPSGYDVVYLDPPYVSAKGSGVDYLDYYHFLEGLANPHDWQKRILHKYKHKPLEGRGESPFGKPATIKDAFEKTVRRFSGSTLVISYRSDGIPSIEELAEILVKAGKQVEIIDSGKYTYALSRNKRSREVVLMGR